MTTIKPLTIAALSISLASFTFAQEFEQPPVLNASQLLQPEFRNGPHFTVAEPVPTEGFLNQYIIVSDYGTFRAEGNSLLVKRINEIQAIAAAKQITSSKAFVDSVVNSALRPVGFGLDLIDEPLKTTGRTVSGAAKYIHRATEGIRRVGNRAETEDSALEAITGMSVSTRQVAVQLNVDPYTTNGVLQDELKSLGFASYAGKLTTLGGYATIGGGWITPTAVVGSNLLAIIHENLAELAPVDIRRESRVYLANSGVPEANIGAFVDNPSMTPSQRLIITRSLESLGPIYGIDNFIRSAASTGSESDGNYFQTNSLLLARYHEQFDPVTHVLDFRGLPVLFTQQKHLVLPLAVDYGVWSESAAALAESFAVYDALGLPFSKKVIFMTGRLSPMARAKIAEFNIEIVEGALGSIYLPEPALPQRLPEK